nr:MAG TPA: hypothetical protein [Caudoviricetes sp.]
MTRLVRLNEVQYAETEDQVTALTAQGFREEALPDAPAPDPESAGDTKQDDTKQEGTPDPEPDKPKGRGAKGGK